MGADRGFDIFGPASSAGKKGASSAGAVEKTVEAPEAFGLCPVCKGKIIKGKCGYGCSNWRAQDGGCRFVGEGMYAGKKLTPAHIRFQGKTLRGSKAESKHLGFSARPQMVGCGSRQGRSHFVTGGVVRYVEDYKMARVPSKPWRSRKNAVLNHKMLFVNARYRTMATPILTACVRSVKSIILSASALTY